MKFFAFSSMVAVSMGVLSTVVVLTAVSAQAADKPAKTAGAAEQMIQKFDKNGDKAARCHGVGCRPRGASRAARQENGQAR